MSYDLFLTFDPAVTKVAFTQFFKGRRNYTIGDGGITYNNKETGVYFVLSFKERKSFFSSVTVQSAHVNINYVRPSFFGIEAEIEIA